MEDNMFDEKLVEVATALITHCRNGTEGEGLDTLYAEDCVSVEAAAMDGGGEVVHKGLAAIRAKHAWWDEHSEVHSFNAEGPFCHNPDRFSVIFEVDVTNAQMGGRMAFREVAVYTLRDGRIAREE
ncbi:MAG: nuclear transport factor 2 family protein, partial [Pseudomonadota bacterium]